jgi:hypothetical protein
MANRCDLPGAETRERKSAERRERENDGREKYDITR